MFLSEFTVEECRRVCEIGVGKDSGKLLRGQGIEVGDISYGFVIGRRRVHFTLEIRDENGRASEGSWKVAIGYEIPG